jgi:FKBP-type peptidyl-prolyl cis-trans isomerase
VAELSRPDVEPPTGPAPDDLVIEDIVVGDGPEATPGSLVSAHYVGVTHDGGEQFDASGTAATRWSSASAWAWSSRAGTRASPA